MQRNDTDPRVDTWDRYWQSVPTTISTNYHEDMLGHLRQATTIEGRRVLDVGGAGAVSRDLARTGADVVLIDFSTVATRNARSLSYETPFEVVQADAHSLPFPTATFDIVIHQGFLEHFSEPTPLLLEQFRVLRDGGTLLVDVPQRFNWYALAKRIQLWRGTWPYGWETDFTHAGLVTLLKRAGFKPMFSYGRGYQPRLLFLLRNLRRIERRLGRQMLPVSIWDAYDAFWKRFELGPGGRHTMVSLGIIARKGR